MIEVYYKEKGDELWKWDGTYSTWIGADKAAKYHKNNGDKVRFKHLV